MSSKIIDLIKDRQFSYSCEITPDIKGSELYHRDLDPLFYSVTWHAKSHQCRNLDIAPLDLAYKLQGSGKTVLLHLSCELLRKRFLDELLDRLQERNINNLFIILGENYDPPSSDFQNTSALIKYIRQKTGQYFCIGVTGYPQSNNAKLNTLKKKVKSGADFIITQAFFERNTFTNFVKKCREREINVPIFPGIFTFESTQELIKFIDLCKVKMSESFKNSLRHGERINFSGQDIIIRIINDIRKSDTDITNFHFFTLNKFANVRFVVNYLE